MHPSSILNVNSYQAQILSPEWRARGRTIRSQRGNSCRICRRGDKPTQVHHVFFDPSLRLEDYDPSDLVLLCTDCHREMHARLQHFRRYVFRYLRPEHLRVLNGALAAGLTHHDPLHFVYAVAEMAASPGSVERFSAAWNSHPPTLAHEHAASRHLT